MSQYRTIFIDVDDTLIRTVGVTRIPIVSSIEFVRRRYAAGDQLYCWSRGGADYSKEIAKSLGILECFTAFLPKPDMVLDDRGKMLLDHCEFVLPGNAANH